MQKAVDEECCAGRPGRRTPPDRRQPITFRCPQPGLADGAGPDDHINGFKAAGSCCCPGLPDRPVGMVRLAGGGVVAPCCWTTPMVPLPPLKAGRSCKAARGPLAQGGAAAAVLVGRRHPGRGAGLDPGSCLALTPALRLYGISRCWCWSGISRPKAWEYRGNAGRLGAPCLHGCPRLLQRWSPAWTVLR